MKLSYEWKLERSIQIFSPVFFFEIKLFYSSFNKLEQVTFKLRKHFKNKWIALNLRLSAHHHNRERSRKCFNPLLNSSSIPKGVWLRSCLFKMRIIFWVFLQIKPWTDLFAPQLRVLDVLVREINRIESQTARKLVLVEFAEYKQVRNQLFTLKFIKNKNYPKFGKIAKTIFYLTHLTCSI